MNLDLPEQNTAKTATKQNMSRGGTTFYLLYTFVTFSLTFSFFLLLTYIV